MFIFGKSNFVSKSGKTCYLLYVGEKNDRVEGVETMSLFVNQPLFEKVKVNANYKAIYGRTYNGSAVLEDLVLIEK